MLVLVSSIGFTRRASGLLRPFAASVVVTSKKPQKLHPLRPPHTRSGRIRIERLLMASLAHEADRSSSTCPHVLRVVGYVRPSARTRVDCLQPLRVVCDLGCGHEQFWRCDCSSWDRCSLCSERKRRLLARIIDLGITDRIGAGYTYFLTVTAPGSNSHRLWVQGKVTCQRPSCECHDNGLPLAEWNAQQSASWNRLRLSLSRLVDGSLTFIGSVEVQARGALHRHVVLNVDRPLMPEEVQSLALAAGYGCVFDLQIINSAQKAAWYISKYVTKSAGARSEVPWVADVLNKETGEIRSMKTSATFRSWSAAHSWGFTLKGLREIARLQARARAESLEGLVQLGDQVNAGSLAPESGLTAKAGRPPP